MLKTNELKNTYRELLNNSIAYNLDDYFYNDNDYLCDSISALADYSIDIYYSELNKWLGDNVGYFEDSINEFGWCGDYYRQIQQAQFMANEEDIYNNLDNALMYMAYSYIESTHEEITEEQAEEVEEIILNHEIDNNSQLYEFYDKINEIINA